jgi:hypothetical protein
MSLYNLLFGKNPNTDIILAILELKESDVERYRDCGFEDDGIYIYTRTGGGNREDYPNEVLIGSQYYIEDEDDAFDCTYATYHFRIPDEIKEDVEKFKNLREEGITAKFIQWVSKTIERDETEEDKRFNLWKVQNKLVQQSKQTFIHESNGHTIVPLDDSSLEQYLKLMEQAGGKQLSYSVMPYKVNVLENVPRWYREDPEDINTEICRVRIEFPKNWIIDRPMWDRWQKKYGEKYPKSIDTIKETVDILLSREDK